MPTADSAIQDAPEPFSGSSNTDQDPLPSDFILRSVDGVDFHVHKDVLKFVSHFFYDMFTGDVENTGDQDPRRDGKSILALPESSSVLYRLLRCAYPAQSAHQYRIVEAELDGVVALHQAAHKYQFIRTQSLIEEMLDDPLLLDSHPQRLFAIAKILDLGGLARKAALRTLKFPIPPPSSDFPEMEHLSWATGQKLHAFHLACCTEARKMVEDTSVDSGFWRLASSGMYDPHNTLNGGDRDKPFVWWDLGLHTAPCGPQVRSGWGIVPVTDAAPWFRNHMLRLGGQLDLVSAADVVAARALDLAPAERAMINACVTCSKRADQDLEVYARQLAERIETKNVQRGQFVSSLHDDFSYGESA
ncbi:hypothetical protein C8R43DRAFT_910036 [Mycena crocata]|nr:hypothetical protein C8R43DRAFT_910036 [Mycena crocata]